MVTFNGKCADKILVKTSIRFFTQNVILPALYVYEDSIENKELIFIESSLENDSELMRADKKLSLLIDVSNMRAPKNGFFCFAVSRFKPHVVQDMRIQTLGLGNLQEYEFSVQANFLGN